MLDSRSLRLAVVLLALVAVVTSGCGDDDDGGSGGAPQRGAGVAIPLVEGPITGGGGKALLGTTTFDLADVGYEESEYFLSGTAHAYTATTPLPVSGEWPATPTDSATYRTRMVVYRPIDKKKFNGTVIVEWLNVSGGVDAGADWIMGHVELIRSGYAYVGVSAQYVGVEGGDPVLPGLVVLPLKTADAARYGSLSHPGDSFSYDIFSQAAQAVRRPNGLNPLPGFAVKAVIAAGESQSAFRMTTYVNAVHPLADIYDGFLVHSRGTLLPAPLAEDPQAGVSTPGAALIRDDVNVPVMLFETETDYSFLGYGPARQPDSEHVRLWDVAGTAHADTYTTLVGMTDKGDDPAVAALVVNNTPFPGFPCNAPVNSGPHHWVLKAAIRALNHWVREGVAPPIAPRLELSGSRIKRDANGNALGGIRMPQVEVPTAKLSGEGQSGSVFCLLFGTTVPFDPAKLTALYPTEGSYVAAFNAAADAAIGAGFLLPEDASLMKAFAAETGPGH